MAGNKIGRRQFLGALAAGSAGVAVGAGAILADNHYSASESSMIAFRGDHQAGIATRPQRFLHFAAIDLSTDKREEVTALLQTWTRAADAMCAGRPLNIAVAGAGGPPDSGETQDIGPSRLTMTFGFGPSFFSRSGTDRFGVAARQPTALANLPSFTGDALEAALCGGDIGVQVCADHPQVAFHAVRALIHLSAGLATLRWSQRGFEPTSITTRDQATPRNLFGQKDGTNNLRANTNDLDNYVWVAGDKSTWMNGGTYLITRRIRMTLDTWDRTPLDAQERVLGRKKSSGAPLNGHTEFDPVDLTAKAVDGSPIIAKDAHIRLASPYSNDGKRILRRGYSFDDGVDNLGLLDAGLFFISFQRDPEQFIAIQRNLSNGDAMHRFLRHTGSAIFACPPGVRTNGWIGEGLFT